MRPPKKFYDTLFVIDDLCKTLTSKLDDYETKIQNDYLLKRSFYNIEFVYMHSVLLDLSKLLSLTNVDKKSALGFLETISPPILKDRISNLRKTNKDIIKKIKNNRDRIIAHVDISDLKSYFKMGFSQVEIDRRVADHRKYLETIGDPEDSLGELEMWKKLKSISIEHERYSPSDFFQDIRLIRSMVDEVQKIAWSLNKHFSS